MSASEQAGTVEAVLAAHERRGWTCICMTWTFTPQTVNYGEHDIRSEHRAHVAAVLAAAGLTTEADLLLCSQCGELESVMVKIGTSDGWCTDCLDRAAATPEVGIKALRWAADEMEAVIADGDVAEVAAFVPGEVGRSAAVSRRDALYEEPHTWLREYADRCATEADQPRDGLRAAVEAFCVALESEDDYVRSWKCARQLRALLADQPPTPIPDVHDEDDRPQVPELFRSRRQPPTPDEAEYDRIPPDRFCLHTRYTTRGECLACGKQAPQTPAGGHYPVAPPCGGAESEAPTVPPAGQPCPNCGATSSPTLAGCGHCDRITAPTPDEGGARE